MMRMLIAATLLLTACGDSATINILDFPDSAPDAPINLWPDAPTAAPVEHQPADAGVGTATCGDQDAETSDMCVQGGRCDGLACGKGEAWLYTCIGARPDVDGCKKRGSQWCCPPSCVRNGNDDANCTFLGAHVAYNCAATPDSGTASTVPIGCQALGPNARGPDYITFCCP